MQILNFNRISIKNRGLDVTFPFTTFARANFPNTRIFLFTLKRFAPKIFKTLLQECSKRILVPSFFRNSIGRFYYYLYKKGVRREIACAPCTGRKKVHNAYFSSLPLPPSPKMIGNSKLLFVSGGKQGDVGAFLRSATSLYET